MLNHTIHRIARGDRAYPYLLQQITGAPEVLYVCGQAEVLSQPQLAIVGSRRPSVNGRLLTQQLTQQLASELIITSGLAYGIDADAHRACLQAGGITIAVIAGGIDQLYPAEHLGLAEQIIDQGGAIVTEWPLGTKPKAAHFPQRNRIMSGLSLGVLVVEATIRSGTMITARHALRQGREVFAIPGAPNQSLSQGPNQLLQQGAKLVATAEDVLEELGPLVSVMEPFALEQKNSHNAPPATRLDIKSTKLEGSQLCQLNEQERGVLTCLKAKITPIDSIVEQSGLTAAEISAILQQLELKAYVQTVAGGYRRL